MARTVHGRAVSLCVYPGGTVSRRIAMTVLAVVTLAVTGGLCALDYRPLMADGFAVTPLDQPAGD